MRPMVHILLISDHCATIQRWAEILDSPQCRLWRGLEELGDDGPLDVVVVDRALASDADASRSKQLVERGMGVVAVGCGGPADVSLAHDCSPNELRLACLLLGQIVQLRRERRQGRRVRQALAQLAMSDPLTGLPNRRAWDDELRSRSGASPHPPLCLALFDLDRFKQVNDLLGHSAGDEALRQVGRSLACCVRREDFVARLGGDEFGLLASDVGLEAATRLVERLRQAACVRLAEQGGLTLTVSAGLAVGSAAEGVERLFAAADESLRQAKTLGRDRTVAGRT